VSVLGRFRVADFCWVGAGSFATKILADAGADVIKIESRASLDGLRLAAPFAGGVRGVNRSGYFADRNSSKRSITINLQTAEGRELARRLVAVSDVVTNNFTPGVMERFGLGYETVREVNPQVIYLAMSMQGDDGPARNYLGYGITIGALTGFQHLTGAPGRVPIGTNTNYPDHIPNPAHAAFAVLAALRHRRRTGEGQYIDLAQTESTIAVLGPAMIEAALTDGADEPTRPGDAGGPMANAHRWRAPHGVYQCTGEDRWVAVSVHEDRQWAALREVLRLDPAALEPGWDTMAGRHRDRDRVDALIAAAARGWDARKMTAALLDAGVPCAPVQDAAEVVADPQLAWRGHWVRPPHVEMGASLYNMPPYRLSATPVTIRSAAPRLGEHTEEICRDVLGLADAEIERLQADGVLS
jgi:benzylsuccinate CoA-transferase BbsF subunit